MAVVASCVKLLLVAHRMVVDWHETLLIRSYLIHLAKRCVLLVYFVVEGGNERGRVSNKRCLIGTKLVVVSKGF